MNVTITGLDSASLKTDASIDTLGKKKIELVIMTGTGIILFTGVRKNFLQTRLQTSQHSQRSSKI